MGSENQGRPRALSLVQQEDVTRFSPVKKFSIGSEDEDDGEQQLLTIQTRARRAASPPPPYLPDLPPDRSTVDSESIACSLYSYTYSQNTAQLVHSRLHGVLRVLQRIQTRNPTNTVPMVPIMGKMANFPIAQDHGPDNIEAYIRVIQSALDLEYDPEAVVAEAPPPDDHATKQRLTVPMVNFFRRESSSWLKSVSRILPDYNDNVEELSKSSDGVKLLELLSTPIVDLQKPIPEKPRLFRRSSSYFSMPLLQKTFKPESTSPTLPTDDTVLSVPKAAYDPTPLCQIPNKYATRAAVFTTTPHAPFKVLGINDIACLMFGIAQHEAMDRPMVDYFSEGARARILDEIDRQPPSICMCGRLLDIVKNNNVTGLASLWVEKSEKCVVWLVEEVEHDYIEIVDNKVDAPPAFSHLKQDSFPGLFSKSPHDLHYYWTLVADRNVPLLVSYNESFKIQIRAPLTIAGAVIVDKKWNVVRYNLSAIHNMLGMGLELVGQSVDALFPRFNHYRKEIERICDVPLMSPGVVIPDHLFRLVASKTAENFFDPYPINGVTALNRDGQELFVDLQVRTISEETQVLWVSYSRPPLGEEQCIIPSQSNLLAISRRMSATPSGSTTTDLVSPMGTPSSSEATTPLLTSKDSASPMTPTSMLPPAGKYLGESGEVSTRDAAPPSPSKPVLLRRVGSLRRVRKFEDFKVIRKLGEGAYGEVLLVLNTKEPQQGEVALKCIAKDRILVDTWTRDRRLGTIPNEIKTMNMLRDHWHPNIIELIDFFEDDKYYHVEMVCHGNPGVDLFDLIESKPKMTEKECQEIFFQVASAVHHLHKLGIVHRDIKDENIIVDQNGVIKLIDFGSAAFTKQGPFDVFVGTVDYAAPEVLEGLPYEGYQQDVWALGILLYTIVYKENPFYNLDEIMEATLRIPHDLSVECSALITSILVRDYRSRPSASAIMEHVWLADEVEAHKNIEGYD